MITGASLDTAYAIGSRIGICEKKEECLDLSLVDEISLEDDSIENYKVFSRVNPLHQVKMVEP